MFKRTIVCYTENEETLNENVKLIRHLQQVNKKLEEENDSKTTIIKILTENKTSNIPTTQSNTEVKNERKPEIKYLNCYETLYITDGEEENDSPNYETTSPEHSSDNPEYREKRKSKWINPYKKNTRVV